MLEAGKSNISNDKVLSIHLQVGGLSFYSHNESKFSVQRLTGNITHASAITKEEAKGDYNVVNIYHNDMSFAMIPEPIFDEDMCEGYLLAKGFSIGEEHNYYVTICSDIAYISLLHDSHVPQYIDSVNVMPLIAKVVKFGLSRDGRVLSYVIDSNKIHIVYSEFKRMLFCETLPLVNSSDAIFFIKSVIKQHCTRGKCEILSLYESGNFAIQQEELAKLSVKRMDNDFFISGICSSNSQKINSL